MTQPPNFLFLITDQHRHDYLGCAGHPVVRTPNLDALAATGTRFNQFYTASPVCMPNRASLLTGRYPSVHGLRYNGCVMPRNTTTFVDALRASGYRTATIGKSHLQPFTNLDPHSFSAADDTAPFTEALHSNAGRYDEEQPERYTSDELYELSTPYYGYDEVTMVTGHGANTGGHYAQWLRQSLPDWQRHLHAENELPHDYTCPQAHRTSLPEDYYSTFYIRDRAIEFIDSHRDRKTPFFSFVSFPDPHHPFTPPGRYWDMYSPGDFDLPLPFSSHKNPPPPLSATHASFINNAAPMTAQTAIMVNDRQAREAMALSCGMITMVDDAVGDIITALDRANLRDNTVIVFTSDHGDYLGDFNLLLKGALPLDSINRAPFIWNDPAAANTDSNNVATTLASTIDIAPTILERAGIGRWWGIQGVSLLDAVHDNRSLRDSLLVEYNDGLARMGFTEPARVRSMITDRFRLTTYRNQPWGELYDRATDPNDCHNQWDAPEYTDVRVSLQHQLIGHLTGLMDESPRAKRLA